MPGVGASHAPASNGIGHDFNAATRDGLHPFFPSPILIRILRLRTGAIGVATVQARSIALRAGRIGPTRSVSSRLRAADADRSLGPRDEKRAWEAARPDNIAAAEARATNENLTVSLRRADRCGGMRVDDWCLRTGRHQLGAAGQREGDGPSHNGGHKAGALSWDHGGRKNSWLSRMRISA